MKIKNGLICVPPLFKNDYTTNVFILLFDRMAEEFNLRIIYSETPEVHPDNDFIFVFSSPQDPFPNAMMNLLELKHNPVIVSNVTDSHFFEPIRDKIAAMLDRSALIISNGSETYRKIWPEFVYKTKFSRNFYQPFYEKLQFNTNPRPKCLLSGDLDPSFYTIRDYIYRNRDPKKIECLPHPGGNAMLGRIHDIRNEKYSQFLNAYFSCIATSSIMKYVVNKHLEILAAGSLLFADRTNDFDLAGAIPNEHYIPIKADTESLEKIYSILEHPQDFDTIRKNGMKFVKENHSLDMVIDRYRKWFDAI